MNNNTERNPFIMVLLGIAITILTGIMIPIVVSALLALLGMIVLGLSCPEIATALVILFIIFGFPVYCMTLAIMHK